MTDKESVRFLNIVKDSAYELNTQIELTKQMNYLSQYEFNYFSNLSDETSRLLSGLNKAKSQYSKPKVRKLK